MLIEDMNICQTVNKNILRANISKSELRECVASKEI